MCASFAAALWRVNLMPIDTLKTTLQVNGKDGLKLLGSKYRQNGVGVFYHGISSTLLFDSTTINLYGPVSTTGGTIFWFHLNAFLCMLMFILLFVQDFTIAWSIFGKNGVVLDIQNANSSSLFFECNYWSAFTHEDEKLFIANRNPFIFANIHNLEEQLNTAYHLLKRDNFGNFGNLLSMMEQRHNKRKYTLLRLINPMNVRKREFRG